MKKNTFKSLTKSALLVLFFTFSTTVFSQNQTQPTTDTPSFWSKVQFGGGFGLGIGSGFTNILVAPSAVYPVNKYFSAGLGLQYSYLDQRGFYTSSQYGASVIGLINPIEEIQLSVELEQLRVNVDFANSNFSDDFWNTGLFLGAGYRAGNVTIGARYNVLFDNDRNVYGDAFLPFVRVFF